MCSEKHSSNTCVHGFVLELCSPQVYWRKSCINCKRELLENIKLKAMLACLLIIRKALILVVAGRISLLKPMEKKGE